MEPWKILAGVFALDSILNNVSKNNKVVEKETSVGALSISVFLSRTGKNNTHAKTLINKSFSLRKESCTCSEENLLWVLYFVANKEKYNNIIYLLSSDNAIKSTKSYWERLLIFGFHNQVWQNFLSQLNCSTVSFFLGKSSISITWVRRFGSRKQSTQDFLK